MNHSIESLIVEQGKMSPSPAFAVRQSMIFSGCCCFLLKIDHTLLYRKAITHRIYIVCFFSSPLYSSADVTMSFGFAFLCNGSLCAPCYCCVSCGNPYLLWTRLPNNSVYSVTISVTTDSWPSPFKYEKVLGLNKSSPCKELTFFFLFF